MAAAGFESVWGIEVQGKVDLTTSKRAERQARNDACTMALALIAPNKGTREAAREARATALGQPVHTLGLIPAVEKVFDQTAGSLHQTDRPVQAAFGKNLTCDTDVDVMPPWAGHIPGTLQDWEEARMQHAFDVGYVMIHSCIRVV